MTQKIILAALAVLLSAVGGCMESMMGPDLMSDEIAAGVQENRRHRDAIHAAGSVGELPAEMDRHESAMIDTMGGMQHAVMEMSHCSGAGVGWMDRNRDDMVAEMDVHLEAMASMADMSAARGEADRHMTAMEAMLDEMREALGHAGCH